MVPAGFKHAVVEPSPKKPGLDHKVLANFRHIPKLLLLQLSNPLKPFSDEHDMLDIFQSQILLVCDSRGHVVLVLLD